MGHDTTVELENDRVKVTRVKTGKRERGAPVARGDRLIIYLHDGHVVRTEGGRTEEIRRRAGDVVWRGRSEHQIETVDEGSHEVLVIELKG